MKFFKKKKESSKFDHLKGHYSISDNQVFDLVEGGEKIDLFNSEEFSTKEFKKNIEDIKAELKFRLKNKYNTDNIVIDVSGLDRDLEDQDEFLKTGASKTSLGLHQFGAAGDFSISIDGVHITGTGRGKGGSIVPYQILGDIALEKGLFWGWKNDLGHVAETRFVDEFVMKYPGELSNQNLKTWYTNQNKLDAVPAIYQQTLELLDEALGSGYKKDRTYIGSKRTIDELEKPISEDTSKISSSLYESMNR